MRYLAAQLRYFYNGIIPQDFKSNTFSYFIFSLVAISVSLVLLLGKKALIILPLIIIVYAAFKYPMSLFYLFLATVPITPYLAPGINTIYSYSLVLSIMALWFARTALGINPAFLYSRFLLGYIILFSLVLIYSALYKGFSTPEIASIMRYAIFFPFVLVVYDMYQPRHTIHLFLAISTPFIISSYYLYRTYLGIGSFIDILTVFRMKPAGIFTNANIYGIMMIFAAPFWIALAVWSKNRILRIIAGILALNLSVSIILTNSRSAMIGLLFSIIFYFALAKKLRYFLSVVAVLSVILISSPLFRIVTSAGLRVERGGSGRVEIWRNTIELIEQNAIFGVGAGNYPEAYRPYFKSAFEKGFMKNISHSHNEILHLFVELGIMGLVLILVLFYVPLKRGFVLLKKPLSDFDRIIVYGSVGILFANLGNSFFDANTMLADGGLFRPILYWITVIIILKMYEKYTAADNIIQPEKN